jgi:hypothetical protein
MKSSPLPSPLATADKRSEVHEESQLKDPFNKTKSAVNPDSPIPKAEEKPKDMHEINIFKHNDENLGKRLH